MFIEDIKSKFAKKVSRKVRPLLNRRILPLSLHKPLVSFTFDDFPKSAITNGARILEKEGWGGTFYTAAGLANTTNHHGPHYSPQDLQELERHGHEIAGHTHSHADLTQMSVSQALQEIDDNRSALKKMGVKGEIANFAYPYGEVSGKLKQALASKFASMRGIQDGAHYGHADLNELKSQAIDSKEHIKGAMSILANFQFRPGWLIIFIHDIVKTPSEWGCTPEQFFKIVNAVKASGAHVLPVNEALSYLEERI